jgi:glutamate-1-semialdehyde 2,1-aminomutase
MGMVEERMNETIGYGSNSALQAQLAEVEAAYVAANPESRAAYAAAAGPMPGGNTRTVLHFSPFPLTFAKGEGCRLWDVDGHGYRDFLGEYSAGLYGHSEPVVQAAIREALEQGIALGGPNRYEARLAAEITARFPSIDQVRFTNSGTEANILAFAAARLATGRDAVMVMAGGYHGGVLYFGQHPSPINLPGPWVQGIYNDVEATGAIIDKEAGRLAAIVIEPMMGSGGGICAEPGFLAMLRARADRHGIVLIFDEVMTSRMSMGGMQERLGVTPDMTTLGKYLGGGLSFGAFGGREELMRRFDPRRPDAVSHAGTFNNNVCSMAGGLAGLEQVLTRPVLDRLWADGEALRARLNEVAQARDVPVQVLGTGSIMGFHFKRGTIRRPQDVWPVDALAARTQNDLYALLHLSLIQAGCYIARRGYVTLSLPMEEADRAALVAAFETFLAEHGELIRELV